jgi:hypothetical protein
LKKKFKEDYRRWKDLLCLWIGGINKVKMTMLPKSNLHVQCNPHQNSNDIGIITEIEKPTLKFILKHKGLQIGKAILSKRSNSGNITIPNFKLFYTDIVIKTHSTCTKTDIKISGPEWKTYI